jgi:hypothetical protein
MINLTVFSPNESLKDFADSGEPAFEGFVKYFTLAVNYKGYVRKIVYLCTLSLLL